ncbi:YhgE/Pip family protein [Marisediminicola sp. LYQ85]|uniref:YhgE/Pip family protein n=1 Tax=Marisediminicola sp. LYQ85 TaxID=3391062 RepID=UPI003982DD05
MSRSSRTPRRSRGIAALAAVALVPLAVAGLVVGALSEADSGLDSIPAAIVNSDELINQTADDGTETPVFAGRQLVTELTADDVEGFEWTITNEDDAEEMLDSGEVYAILTVPEDFSESILSLQGDDPQQATIDIRTDDRHSYLAGAVAETVGSSLTSAFGSEITAQYLSGLYSGFGELGAALSDAADGATELESGSGDLTDGLDELATGAGTAASGADTLSSGVSEYTDGVGALSSGLGQLQTGAGGLSTISSSLGTYTSGVSQLSAGIAGATAALGDGDPSNDAVAQATLAALSAQLQDAAAGGAQLSAETTGALQGVQSGIAQSATGAQQLAAGSAALDSGASSLASGLTDLETGAAASVDGSRQLTDGLGELADGLATGAEQVPASADDTTDAIDVASDPVGLEVDRDNEVTDIGQLVSTFFVPLGLWLGALAIFLVARLPSASSLGSTARGTRIVGVTLGRASIVAAVQALLLVLLLHTTLDVAWSLVGWTTALAIVMAVSFTALHYLLTLAFGRVGLVVSLLLLAIQATATGGVYPVEVLAGPFEAISPALPLTYGVAGMQAVLTGADPGAIVGSILALLAFGVLSALLSVAVLSRVRRTTAIARLAPAS